MLWFLLYGTTYSSPLGFAFSFFVLLGFFPGGPAGLAGFFFSSASSMSFRPTLRHESLPQIDTNVFSELMYLFRSWKRAVRSPACQVRP